VDQKIRVGAVNYLNTKPLLFGMDQPPIAGLIQLSTNYPSAVAQQLLHQTIDIGLVPVSIIPQMPHYYIDTDYCIGANGPVASVCLFSQVPIAQIETVLLDYQSRTSVLLVQILLRHFWKQKVKLVQAKPGFEQHIAGTTAAVVIGDRAMQIRSQYDFVFDLAEAWKKFSGLPFVFATWVANKPLPASFYTAFNQANHFGLQHLQQVVAQNPFEAYNLHHYFTQNISYQLTEPMRAGLQLFLKYVRQMEPSAALV
jgi:chorismate dehydratase